MSISIVQRADGVELLRFDCYEDRPHYHYDPNGAGRVEEIDRFAEGDAASWALRVLEERLAPMLARAGAVDATAAARAAASDGFCTRIATAVRAVDEAHRSVTRHRFGDELFTEGPLTIGVERQVAPPYDGVSFHVVGHAADGSPQELVCLDCFGADPHYHYAPMVRDNIHHIDLACVDDTIAWGLDVIASRRLLPMIAAAGFFDVAAAAAATDLPGLVRSRLGPAVERMRSVPRVEAIR